MPDKNTMLEQQEYFEDPIVDDIKKNIIKDIDFFSYETPSIQNHVASHYSKGSESSSECTEKKTN